MAGIVAWLTLNAFAYLAAPIFGLSFGPVAQFFGSLLLPNALISTQTWVGRAMFLAAALGWSLLYRRIGNNLPGTGWVQGLVFGIGIWIATAILLPLIGAVHPLSGLFGTIPGMSDPGLFGFGFAGSAGVTLSVVSHLVFGATLGVLVGSRVRTG